MRFLFIFALFFLHLIFPSFAFGQQEYITHSTVSMSSILPECRVRLSRECLIDALISVRYIKDNIEENGLKQEIHFLPTPLYNTVLNEISRSGSNCDFESLVPELNFLHEFTSQVIEKDFVFTRISDRNSGCFWSGYLGFDTDFYLIWGGGESHGWLDCATNQDNIQTCKFRFILQQRSCSSVTASALYIEVSSALTSITAITNTSRILENISNLLVKAGANVCMPEAMRNRGYQVLSFPSK